LFFIAFMMQQGGKSGAPRRTRQESCLSGAKTLIIEQLTNVGGGRHLAAVSIYGDQTLPAVF
jgi:hypothetical protein